MVAAVSVARVTKKTSAAFKGSKTSSWTALTWCVAVDFISGLDDTQNGEMALSGHEDFTADSAAVVELVVDDVVIWQFGFGGHR